MSFGKYIVVGIWNTFFGLSVFIFLSFFFKDMNSIVVLGISYVISTLQAHFSQRKLVWNSDADYFPELFKFSSFYLLQFAINSVLLVIMNNVLSSPREFNQIVIIGILTIVFFFVNRNGVFNVTRRQRQH